MSVGASQTDPHVTDGMISGYVLVERILDRFGDKGVAKLLECTNYAETEFLEFKTNCALSEEERKKGVSQDALTWDIVQAIFAIANTAGGALLIGICNDGKNMFSVGVGEDPERFLRCTIMQKLLPDQRKWSDGKGGRWSAVGLPMVEPRLCHYSRGKQSGDVVVLLIEPCPRGKCLKFEDDVNRNGKLLCYRKQGCGKTVTNKDSEGFNSIDQNRRIERCHYLTLLQKYIPDAEPLSRGAQLAEYNRFVKSGLCGFEFDRYRDSVRYYCMSHDPKSEEEYASTAKPAFSITDTFRKRVRLILQTPAPSQYLEHPDLRDMPAKGCDFVQTVKFGCEYWRDNASDEEISSKR